MRVLTFDIEEWFHILDTDSTRTQAQWDRFDSRIHANLGKLLGFLEERNQKATFFCLGWIAGRYPEVIRQIDALGFEIGSHSDMHELVYEQTRQSFKADLEASIKRLEDLTGKKVRTYRAPGFSITPRATWAFEILSECGIEIDCSVFTAARAHGGYPGFACHVPCRVRSNGAMLKEFPLSPFRLGPVAIPFSGGGYLRILPYSLINRLVGRSRYVMVYLHYRDFDCGQAVVHGLPLHRRFKSYVGIKGAFKKLERLISDFEFVDVRGADAMIDWETVPVVPV